MIDPASPDLLAIDQLGWEVVDRLLAGTTTAEDVASLRAFQEQWPEAYHSLLAVRAAVASTAAVPPAPSENIQARAMRVRGELAPGKGTGALVPPGSARRRQMVAQWMAATIAVFAVMVTLLIWRLQPSPARPVAMYQTLPGQRVTVTLPNTARVTLAPATMMRVMPQVILLSGEAWFDVASHPARAVIVQTRNATIRVLGTRFAVRQYPQERASQVVVENGRIALQSRYASTPAVLTARMMGRMTDSGLTVTPNISVNDYTAWTQGRLVFRDTPLRDVIIELARAYGTDIRVSDSTLASQPVTLAASIQAQSLPQLLDWLGRAADAHVQREGKSFVLRPGRVTRSVPRLVNPQQVETEHGR